MVKTLALLALSVAVPLLAQEDRPVRYHLTNPSGTCSTISGLWNNWVLGRVYQCVGPNKLPNAGAWQLVTGSGLEYTAEDAANKSTSTSLGNSDALYPSQNAVKVYVDAHAGVGAVTVKGGPGTPNAGGTNPTTCTAPTAMATTVYTDTSSPDLDTYDCTGTDTWQRHLRSDGDGPPDSIELRGATSGSNKIQPADVAGTSSTTYLPSGASSTAKAEAGAAHNFLTGFTALGLFTKGQPSAADLSDGVSGTGLVCLSVGSLCTTAGSGDFVGPASATDNALIRFDGTTGKLGQDSKAIMSDAGDLTVGASGRATLGQHGAGGGGLELDTSGLNATHLGAFDVGGVPTIRAYGNAEPTLGVVLWPESTIQTKKIFTVGTLPTCDATAEGKRASVSDLTGPTFGSTAAGSGAVRGPVYCDGTNWVVF